MSTNTTSTNEFHKGLVLLGFGTLLFSVKGILIKLAYQYSVNPTVLMTLRMLMALPFYLFVLRQQVRTPGNPQINRKQFFYIAVFGLMGYYLASWLDLTGLLYLPANMERLVLYCYPTIVLILSVVFLRQKLTPGLLLSLTAVYAGLFTVFAGNIVGSGEAPLLQPSSKQFLGVLLVFGSALSFAIFFVGADVMMRKLPSKLFTSISMLAASAGIIIHFLIAYPVKELFNQAPPVYGYGLAIAIFCTVIPSFMVAAGVKRIGAATGSIVGGIGPVFTLIIAFIVLGESISLAQGVGFSIVIVAIFNLARLKKRISNRKIL